MYTRVFYYLILVNQYTGSIFKVNAFLSAKVEFSFKNACFYVQK